MKNKLFDRIERLQDQALYLNDMKTAIKLNWLKYSINALTYNEVCFSLQSICIFDKYVVDFPNTVSQEELDNLVK